MSEEPAAALKRGLDLRLELRLDAAELPHQPLQLGALHCGHVGHLRADREAARDGAGWRGVARGGAGVAQDGTWWRGMIRSRRRPTEGEARCTPKLL